MRSLLLAVPLLLVVARPAVRTVAVPIPGPVANVVLDDVYYGAGPSAGDPLYEEHVLDVIFPLGAGPVSMGYPAKARPLVVFLRGGYQNKPLADPANIGAPVAQSFLKFGFVYAEPSYAEIDVAAKEPPINATVDISRAIQFLRSNQADWNIDPERVVVYGRSAGAYEAYDVGLRWDWQDPSSPDPVLHFSSRPDAVISWGGVSDFTCFFKQAPALPFFFEVDSWTQVTEAQKIDASPTRWLADPAAYARSFTPPIALLHNLGSVTPCGEVISPHDGRFGLVMLAALQDFDRTQGPDSELFEQAILLNTGALTEEQLADQSAAWAKSLGKDLVAGAQHR